MFSRPALEFEGDTEKEDRETYDFTGICDAFLAWKRTRLIVYITASRIILAFFTSPNDFRRWNMRGANLMSHEGGCCRGRSWQPLSGPTTSAE